MKKIFCLSFVFVLIAVSACETLNVYEIDKGHLSLSFNSEQYKAACYAIFTKSVVTVPDTGNFILHIRSSDGIEIYKGKYSERPQDLSVNIGSYDISVVSMSSNKPAFEAPVYGDSTTVVVEAGQTANVEFACKQINSGIRIIFADNFKEHFVGDGLVLSHKDGILQYKYTEARYAFFNSGNLKFIYNNGNKDTMLLEKQMKSSSMLTCRLSYSAGTSSGKPVFSFNIDTARIWSEEYDNIGIVKPADALNVSQIPSKIGESNIKVFGYVVGGDATKTSFKRGSEVTSKTHILIADSRYELSRDNCFTIELPSGKIRDVMNIVDNQEISGTAVVVTGTVVESYLGSVGIKNITSYSILK